MHKRVDKIIGEFEASATSLFFHLSHQFKDAAAALDRKKDENVFQQLGSQYTFTFKEQLTQQALALLEVNRDIVDNPDLLQRLISIKLEEYVSIFRQQSKQL